MKSIPEGTSALVHCRSCILLVEDDNDSREALSLLLNEAGYDVLEARNGREAMDLLLSGIGRPDLILLDLMMPVMNGWQFLEERRGLPALSRVPVVVQSACRQSELENISGAVVITKPISSAALLNAVESVLRPA